MKDVIIEEMTREKEALSKSIANTIASAEMTQVLSLVNLAEKYLWAINNADLDAAKKLGLSSIKKYWRHAG